MIGEELQEIVDEAEMKMDDAVQYLKKNFHTSEPARPIPH